MKFASVLAVAALLFAHAAPTVAASPPVPAAVGWWQMPPFEAVAASGELGRRLRLSYARLDKYTPAFTFEGNEGWPGDREGRALLGQVLTAQASGRPARHADAIVQGIRERLNDKGYMGPVVPDGLTDEQVLSGHSWLLRGLVAYHRHRKDQLSLQIIKSIVDNLLLPARAAYERYPLTAKDRPKTGHADGTIVGKPIEGWRLSSDIGCAFIMLDGATDAYDLVPSPELKSLIELMVQRFAKLNLLEVSAQTHASLSAARAILRFARHSDTARLVALAESVFTTYKGHGMTDHFANDNWFGRPLWTEGCAIIDSFDVAMLLFAATDRTAYLEDAQNIYFNGIGYNQRPSGGFGCDSCPGKNGEVMLHTKQPFEAFFCCSMRGGEGMARATAWTAVTRGNTALLTTLQDEKVTLALPQGPLELSVKTGFPIAGRTQLRVLRAPKDAVTLAVFVPSWVQPAAVEVRMNGKRSDAKVADGRLLLVKQAEVAAGARFDIDFPIELRSEAPVNQKAMAGHHVFRHGPLVLGVPLAADATAVELPAAPEVKSARRGRYTLAGKTAITLEPITGLAFMNETSAQKQRHQILFRATESSGTTPAAQPLPQQQ